MAELVPGDIVAVEAGDVVPADGRLISAAALEIDESALTGESTPAAKSIDPVGRADVPLGDRTCMAFMNTAVTRGAGQLLVTTTWRTCARAFSAVPASIAISPDVVGALPWRIVSEFRVGSGVQLVPSVGAVPGWIAFPCESTSCA